MTATTMNAPQSTPRILGALLILLAVLALTASMALPALNHHAVENHGSDASVARQQLQTIPHWLDGEQAKLREGLQINDHAAKHQAQQLNAWKLQQLLSQGQCVASRKWCGLGEKELYVCADPVSGLIGGLLVIGDEIVTGYAGSEGYWHGKVASDEWGRCDGRSY